MGRWQNIRRLWILGSMVLGVVSGPYLQAAPPSPTWASPIVAAKAAELMDARTGKVLFALHADDKLPMASVTKLMTLYLALRAVAQHRVRLNEYAVISEDAYHVNGSQIWLEPGEQMSVDHLIRGVAIASANDAAYALAEFLAGSEPTFVAEMNRTAADLDMHNTHFSNPHGLHLADHYTTASDMAKLARAAVKLPILLHYTSMREDRSVRNGKGGTLWMINHNRLLRQYPGADGLKTGYTSQAGYCIVATARRGSTRMIAVVLGAPTSKARFQDAATLMSWGFEHFRTIPLVRPGQILGMVPVKRGVARSVAAVMPNGLAVTVPRDSGNSVKIQVHLAPSLLAPVSQGQTVGTVSAYEGPQRIAERNLVASRAVAKSRFLGRLFHYFLKFVG